MFKKLDILVVKAFIGPFIATFFLTLFVLILQFFWLWIDDYVGKGIDGITVIRLVIYLSATLVPLAMPLAVLLSSIMTFGNLGETFELVAIKSAGIGLLRFMRPLLVVSILFSGMAFLFNNYVIPIANLKMKTLHNDLVNKRPAFDLKEGVFYTTIPGFAIKVAKKEQDSVLQDVVIYEQNLELQDNIVVAEKGIMRVTPDKRFLEFTLLDGWRYQEDGPRNTINTQYIRLGFKEYKKVLDLSALQFNPTSDSVFKNRYEMLSVRQLGIMIDSLKKGQQLFETRSRRDMQIYLDFARFIDTGWITPKTPLAKLDVDSFYKWLPDSARFSVLEQAASYAGSVKTSLEGTAIDYEMKRKDLRMHQMTWHEKFTMSIAVLVLFLIGAPLGSIVRKGGIGTPVVFAVIFFVIFFLLNNFGKKFVKEDVLPPFTGMWLATMVLLPIGFFLIWKALDDSQLFNKEFYFRILRAVKKNMPQKAKAMPAIAAAEETATDHDTPETSTSTGEVADIAGEATDDVQQKDPS
ncbi:MAG: LptF/LptG family permease [Candidatus Pseudobacter hemicellulosilyticus]|uniref:LptF/LptG family permease n=1 Tax=Candidatus Pseudobacter hemicellulosilyticus TaxID=3121375 RepID=A0AAJ5WV89_9BACT|nr:MAG: LptF/LptG family permease [Pseudobacter sp.]